jgi:hypothetical protein
MTKPLLSLGIDPGARAGGYAILRFREPARAFTSSPELVCAGKFNCAESREHIGSVLSLAGLVETVLVAVEWPKLAMWGGKGVTAQEVYARAKNVERLQGVVRGIEEAAHNMGVPLVLVEPDEWKRALGTKRRRKGERDDLLLVAMLPRIVAGWPARSNTHVRDAAGIAIVGARKWVAEQNQAATNLHGSRACLAALGVDEKGAA